MAFVKTDYGLIYNDDGSLCVTQRRDDSPFPGIVSWAVEEGTTNLLDLSNIIQSIGNDLEWDAPYANASLSTDLSTYTYTLTTLSDNTAGYGIVLEVPTASENTTYTVSGYIYWGTIDDRRGLHIRYYDSDGNIINDDGSYYHKSEEQSIVNIEGYFSHTFTTPTGTTKLQCYVGLGGNSEAGDWVKLVKPQIEQKPFPTSFVDGTRIPGNLSKPINLDINNAVISFWYKTPSTATTNGDGNRIISFSDTIPNYTSDGFGVKLSNTTPTNATILVFDRTSGTTNTIGTFNVGDLTQWRYFVIVFNGSLCSIYLDGVKAFEYTHNLNTDALNYINIPDSQSGNDKYLDTLLLADIYIGRAVEDGNLVWTDTYIKQVYENRAPFNAS